MTILQSSPLMALSPLDGRYRDKCEELSPIFSEFGLMRYRLRIEISWLQKLADCDRLSELESLSPQNITRLNELYESFDLNDANRIKDIEKQTNHDVKAVEYFIKEKCEDDPAF
jgi:adenylosuccinate lyase